MPSVDEIAASVDDAALLPIVREILGEPVDHPGTWRRKKLRVVSGLPDYRGLFRFDGQTEYGGEQRRWSTVLKLAKRHPTATDDPRDPGFWSREQEAFSSGLLAGVSGITPVRCYEISPAAENSIEFWLEDLTDEYDQHWPLERYGLAARHLGQMGGEFLAGRPLPDFDWLSQRRVGGGGRVVESLTNSEATWRNETVRRLFREPVEDRLRQQLADRRLFRDAIAALPVTLCHNDSHDENLFSRRNDDGTQETVAVDWELVGIGPISSDITFLVVATLRRLAVDMQHAEELEEAVIDGYISGLRDAGWNGDERQVRIGYTAAVALRLGLLPAILTITRDEASREEAERVWNRPAEELADRWAQVAYFVLDRADRAREMLSPRS